MTLSRLRQVKQEEQSWMSILGNALPFEFSAPSVENLVNNLNNSKNLIGGGLVFIGQFAGAKAAQCLTQDGADYLLHCDWIQNAAYHRESLLSAGLKACGTVLANATDCIHMPNATSDRFGSDAYYNFPVCTVTHSSDVPLPACMNDYLTANTPIKETVTCPDLGTLAVVAVGTAVGGYVFGKGIEKGLSMCGFFSKNKQPQPGETDPLLSVQTDNELDTEQTATDAPRPRIGLSSGSDS